MDRPEACTSQQPLVLEDAILKYRPNVEDRLLLNNLPGGLLTATIPFLVIYEVAGGGLVGAVLGALAAAAGLWALSSLAAPSVMAEVRADSVKFVYALTKPEIRFEETGRIKIARATEWGEARAALERKGAKRGFFVWGLKSPETPIPGDLDFQAEVVGGILKRRGDIPVDEDAAKLLTGELGLPWKHRLLVVIGSGAAAAVMSYLLIVSIWRLVAPVWVVLALPITAAFSASAMCLKRESWGKAAVASLGFGVVAVQFVLFGLANAYGYTEYMPLVYAAGTAFCAAGFLASLPLRIRPLHFVTGEAVLLAVLVAVTWSVTLRGTIPVRQVCLAPSPTEVYFSPNGNSLVTDGMADKRHAVHFVDRQSLQSSSVSAGFSIMWPVSVSEDAALCVNMKRHLQWELWFLRAGSEPERIAVDGMVHVLSRSALSPDGRHFAFFVSEPFEGTDRRKWRDQERECRLCVLDIETLAVRDAGLVLKRPPGWSLMLTWRADGRLVWADRTPSDEEAARFRLWSWELGEESPRLEFESAENWSDVNCSPGFRKALALVHTADGKVATFVDLSDGSMVSVPGLVPERFPFPRGEWLADGRRYAYVPEDSPRSVAVVDTDGGRSLVVCSPAPGKIAGVAISPSGRHATFLLKGDWWTWFSATYVSNLETGATHRLRPLAGGLSGLFSGEIPGATAWSPDGDTLAVAVHAFPPAAFMKDRAGAVWLVDELP